jgi:hypothetical protein
MTVIHVFVLGSSIHQLSANTHQLFMQLGDLLPPAIQIFQDFAEPSFMRLFQSVNLLGASCLSLLQTFLGLRGYTPDNWKDNPVTTKTPVRG